MVPDRDRAMKLVALNAALAELRRLPPPATIEEAVERRAAVGEIRRAYESLKAAR